MFVEIRIDSKHLLDTVLLNLPQDRLAFHERLAHLEDSAHLPAGTSMGAAHVLKITDGNEQQDGSSMRAESPSTSREPTRLALVSTIQFAAALQTLKDSLSLGQPAVKDQLGPSECCSSYEATIPRSKPLSPGEILGCTAPTLQDVDALV